jgi:hypothetical protein
VEYFNYLGSIIKTIRDAHAKLSPGIPWKCSLQQKKDSSHQQTGLSFKEETSKELHSQHSCVVLKWEHFGKEIKNNYMESSENVVLEKDG